MYRSKLILYEDGVRLGRRHSWHQRIREKGEGRYSHWDQTLYFSTSDNSDPNKNGRRYELRPLGQIREDFLAIAQSQVRAPHTPIAGIGGCTAVIALLGCSFSGSTLANTILGSHPEIWGAGEIHRLVDHSGAAGCVCCREHCPFWTPAALREVKIDNIYDLAARRLGRPVICDSSKMPDWLVRHVSSILEKDCAADASTALRDLHAFYDRFSLPGERIPKSREDRIPVDFALTYENLVTATTAALSPIMAALNLSSLPDTAAWLSRESHQIGGNVGPMVHVANFQPTLPTARRKYSKPGLFMDNSYREILSGDQIYNILTDDRCAAIMSRFYPGGGSATLFELE